MAFIFVGSDQKLKQKVFQRDAIIRKSAESSLNKKVLGREKLIQTNTLSPSHSPQLSKKYSSMINLKSEFIWSSPLILNEDVSVLETCQLMAAKRLDAVLISSASSKTLIGIATDKDITYKIVSESIDPRTAKLFSIMTHQPIFIRESSNTNQVLEEGLKIMTSKHFRHLPILNGK